MCQRNGDEIRDEVRRRAEVDDRIRRLEEENAELYARIEALETTIAVAAGALGACTQQAA